MEATKERGLKPRPKGTRARYTTATTTTHNDQHNNTQHTGKGNDTHNKQTNNKQSVDKQRTMCYYNNVKRTTHNNNKREEVQSMKTVIVEYTVISPTVLANKVEEGFSCLCSWKDIDEDCFKFTVIGVCAYDMDELEDVLAEYE